MELLVVIAILGILVSLLLPSLSKAKEKAMTAVCLSNMRQVFIHSQVFMNSHDSHLPALDGDSSEFKSENSTGQTGTVELMLFAQNMSSLPGGNFKTEEFLCPSDRVPNHNLNNSDERQISYHANHYPWLSGGASEGPHKVSSYVLTNPNRIKPKIDLSYSDMIIYSEGDWANRGIVRNYKTELRTDDIPWTGAYWHYRLDHAGGKNMRTLNNIYFDGHAKTLAHWTNLEAMKSTQWGTYKYNE